MIERKIALNTDARVAGSRARRGFLDAARDVPGRTLSLELPGDAEGEPILTETHIMP